MRPLTAPGLLAAALLPAALAAQAPANGSAPPPATPVAPAAAPPVAPAPTPAPVALSGESRMRGELVRPGGELASDGFTVLRTRLAARVQAGHRVRAVLGVQANRTLDAEAAASGADALDVYEGYLELAQPVRAAQLALRTGRQELVVGNERLVGRRNWSNTRSSFDGVRLVAGPAPDAPKSRRPAWSATAFAMTPAVHPSRAVAASVPTALLFGADVLRPVFGASGATAEATLVHDRGTRSRTREVAARTTAAVRIRAPRLLGLSADLEGAWQTGTQFALATATAARGADEAIGAWMVGARLGTPTGAKRRLTAAAGVDLLSGDAPASPTHHGAFDTLYGSNHGFYGLADIAGGNPASTLKARGLADALATGTLLVSRRVSVRTDLHRMTPMRGRGLLGWEADVLVPVRVMPGVVAELGQSAFRAGDAGQALGLGPARGLRAWSWLQLTASF